MKLRSSVLCPRVSVPLRGRGLKADLTTRVVQEIKNGHVSVPLRGRGLKAVTNEQLSGIADGIEFQSPYGEEV